MVKTWKLGGQCDKMDKKSKGGKEGNSNLLNEVMRQESEKRLGCVTQESEYIKIWVINSGRKLVRALCKDRLLLRDLCVSVKLEKEEQQKIGESLKHLHQEITEHIHPYVATKNEKIGEGKC